MIGTMLDVDTCCEAGNDSIASLQQLVFPRHNTHSHRYELFATPVRDRIRPETVEAQILSNRPTKLCESWVYSTSSRQKEPL